MASSKGDDQLIRVAELRRFVGTFAREEDRVATAAALTELARASVDTGLTDEATRRAHQALHLLTDEDASEQNIRSLLQLATACLALDEIEAAHRATMLATVRATTLDNEIAEDVRGAAALLAGIASTHAGDTDTARAQLDIARDLLVAANRPDGAALALTQLGLLDAEAERWDAAALCFGFARDFYRAAGSLADAAHVETIAARTFAGSRRPDRDLWFHNAATDAEGAGDHLDAAALMFELSSHVGNDGNIAHASEIAIAAVPNLEMAFTLELQARDEDRLTAVLEVVARAVVSGHLGDTGRQLLDKFQDELERWGFRALAKAAREARAVLASEL